MAKKLGNFQQECPYCKEVIECDTVDVGVGHVQCGPYHCYSCQASEIGPELDDWKLKDRFGNVIYLQSKRKYYDWLNKGKGGKARFTNYSKYFLRLDAPVTEEEIETGFYRGRISPYANTVDGCLVGHETAKAAYRVGRLDEKKLPNTGEIL